jgi:hypothetical protein
VAVISITKMITLIANTISSINCDFVTMTPSCLGVNQTRDAEPAPEIPS